MIYARSIDSVHLHYKIHVTFNMYAMQLAFIDVLQGSLGKDATTLPAIFKHLTNL